MAGFSQTTFFGASVTNFSGTQGFNGSPASITVSLAEDDKRGDSFSQPPVGSPGYFSFGRFSFGGLVQNWSANADASGNPIYSVTLVSPDELLSNCTIITNGYSGLISTTPNLYNVYGQLESTGFGNSLVNDAGIKWATVVSTVVKMIAANPISFRGSSYTVDLSSLPTLPADYRVGGAGSITLGELVEDICSAASHDYFYRLESGNVIRLVTIDRSFPPSFGLIANFVASTDGASAKNVGRELRNEVTSKFLVGGQVERIWYVSAPDMTKIAGNENDAAIWPFWGFDINNKPIIGKSTGDNHNFKIDARFLKMPEIGDEYHTNLDELRCVLENIESWQTFLWIEDGKAGSIHQGRATKLKIISNGTREIRGLLTGKTAAELRKMKPEELIAAMPADIAADNSPTQEEKIQRLYDALRAFAEDYYGRKFMCRLPNIQVKRVPDTNNIIYSDEPTTSGFIAEDAWPHSIGRNLLPQNIDRVLDADGKVEAFVRFDDLKNLDLTQLSPDDFILNNNSVFVKAIVEPLIIFRDPVNLSDPRAVITLPAPVFRKVANGLQQIGSLLYLLLTDVLKTKGIADEDERLAIIENLFQRAGGESLLYSKFGEALMPAIAAVPLRSNILTYGPWFAVGADGKTEFEKDESLTPWDFGSWTGMNDAGRAKVIQALSNNQQEESGTVSVPGAPDRSLGDQLLGGGPYITDINCAIDTSQGVITTYNMRTWTPRLDRLAQAHVDRLRRAGKTAYEQRRALRQVAANRPLTRAERRRAARQRRAKRKEPFSSNQIVVADVITEGGGSPTHNVVFSPPYNVVGQLTSETWEKKAIMSLDGLLRPFGINEGSEFSCLEEPSASADSPTSEDLNPFKNGHDITLLTQGSAVPTNGLLAQEGFDSVIRAVALRGPLVITGWGYDVNGKPVPNSSEANPTDEFAESYLSDPSTWKTGPLDARWDDDRKVWVAGGATDIITFRALHPIYPGTSGLAINVDTSSNVHVFDRHWQNFFIEGESGIAIKINDYYVPLGEHGLIRMARPASTVSPGASTSVTLLDRSEIISSVFLDVMARQPLISGYDSVVKYEGYRKRWSFINAGCM